MARKNRTPEEKARREKIRELLQMANIGSMDDIQNLFKETIAEFMENGLEAELEDSSSPLPVLNELPIRRSGRSFGLPASPRRLFPLLRTAYPLPSPLSAPSFVSPPATPG